MRSERSTGLDPLSTPSTERELDSAFQVPSDGRALLIRNGVPEQYCPPGEHVLPAGKGKVEVRLLTADVARQPVLAPPDYRALALPFDRSLLFVDGNRVGVLKPSHQPRTGGLKAWEGFQPARESQGRTSETLKTCLTERLRSCLPSAGVCCGARIPALSGPSRL